MGSVATWATRGATPAPCAPCASGTSRANVPSGSVAKKGGEVGGQRGRAALVGDRWSHEVGRKGQAYTSRKRVRPSLASASPRGDRAHAFSAGSQHADGAVSAFEPLRPSVPYVAYGVLEGPPRVRGISSRPAPRRPVLLLLRVQRVVGKTSFYECTVLHDEYVYWE